MQLREQLESNVAGDLALEVRVQLTATQRRGGGDQRARDQDEEYPDEQAAIARLEGIVDQRAEAERDDPVEDGLDRAGRQDYRTHGAARPAVLPDSFEQLQRRQAAARRLAASRTIGPSLRQSTLLSAGTRCARAAAGTPA